MQKYPKNWKFDGKNIYFFSHNNQSKEIQDIINSSLKIYDDFRHLGTLFL